MTHNLKPAQASDPQEHPATVYVLMGLCYLLIAVTLYVAWQKANGG